MSDDVRGEQAVAWDRVGQYLENSAGLGERVLRRSMDLWGEVSGHLGGGRYRADDLASDLARAMTVLQTNAEDAWTTMTRPPERQRYVATLPTAFLFFDRPQGQEAHTLLDPVIIPVPPTDTRPLPETALVALDGTSSEHPDGGGQTSQQGVEALLGRLRARRGPQRRYILETVNPGDQTTGLVAGVYDGLIYLKDPPLPLANLRVIVEGPPPVV